MSGPVYDPMAQLVGELFKRRMTGYELETANFLALTIADMEQATRNCNAEDRSSYERAQTEVVPVLRVSRKTWA